MFLRYNKETGRIGIYASKEEATNNGMPVYASEAELAKGAASMEELVFFFNKLTGSTLSKFRDKATAAKRCWAAALDNFNGAVVGPKEAEKEAAEAKQPADKGKDQEAPKRKRGRAPGSGVNAGKTLLALKQVNPRRPGSHGFRSFEIIREAGETGVLYEDYVAKGGRSNDLKWDVEHGNVQIK